MTTVLLVILLFFFSVIIHINCCRNSSKQGLKSKLFLQISAISLLVFIIIVNYFSLPLLWTCSIVFLMLIPAYLVVYVTTELVSPSKKILMSVSAEGGLTYDQIVQYLEKESLLSSRLEELVQSGCVALNGDRFVLTGSGKALAEFLDIYGKILGRGVGG